MFTFFLFWSLCLYFFKSPYILHSLVRDSSCNVDIEIINLGDFSRNENCTLDLKISSFRGLVEGLILRIHQY